MFTKSHRSNRRDRFFAFGIALVFAFITGCTHQQPSTSTAWNGWSDAGRTPSSEVPLFQPWSYDPGPNPQTAMGKELIDIVATQPNMPGISEELTGSQKFRPAFGPTLWRMIQKPNSIKILFIGQDGTHIAEAAGRTATAGFGGRAQDMAAHFGVNQSAAFMNNYAYTIKGQYSSYGAPVLTTENGKRKLSFNYSVTDNGVWLMSQDLNSPMVKWRNKLIDWIIRNNKESLKLVVLFGGAAQDAIGTYIEANGGKVGARYTAEQLAEFKVKVPLFDNVSAGSNKELPVPLTKNKKDLYKEKGFNLPYAKLGGTDKNAEAKLMEAKNYLISNIDSVYSDMAIPEGGVANSGVIHPAQIGGYDLTQIYIDGKKTISLKGLKLSDGTKIKNDILVAEFPHPTSLSTNSATAPAKVEKSLVLLKPMRDKGGWSITPDQGLKNKFAANENYKYGRADIPVDFYDFGTPKNRMVSVSSASRMSGKPNIVVIGTRDRATFDTAKLEAATKIAKPAGINEKELFTARPRTEDRYVFDLGPGEKMARIMKENIDMNEIGKPNSAGTFNIKSHPEDVGDFGHYRGTFVNPQVVVLADPDGVDDILTSRALTGARGQYLQTLMNGMGVKDKYLVIKTVPFGMDGATDAEWKKVLSQTAEYRKAIFEEVLQSPTVKLIITDGDYAAADIKKINTNGIPVVNIKRTGLDNNSGIAEAASAINKSKAFKVGDLGTVAMSNIPRTHLGFFSRVWEGTSGTRVFNATSPADRGIAYAIVAPQWAYYQKAVSQSSEERAGVKALKDALNSITY